MVACPEGTVLKGSRLLRVCLCSAEKDSKNNKIITKLHLGVHYYSVPANFTLHRPPHPLKRGPNFNEFSFGILVVPFYKTTLFRGLFVCSCCLCR